MLRELVAATNSADEIEQQQHHENEHMRTDQPEASPAQYACPVDASIERSEASPIEGQCREEEQENHHTTDKGGDIEEQANGDEGEKNQTSKHSTTRFAECM